MLPRPLPVGLIAPRGGNPTKDVSHTTAKPKKKKDKRDKKRKTTKACTGRAMLGAYVLGGQKVEEVD